MTGRELANLLGPVGVWTFALERRGVASELEALGELRDLGFSVVWVPEGQGSKEILSHSALLLAGTEGIAVATGIASIWARDPVAMSTGARTMAEAFPRRFVLGIGVSHRTSVDRRGAARYDRPYHRMVEYLEAMAAAPYSVTPPPPLPPVVLAALGPRMLRLAAERTAGAHPYFVPVEHTSAARETLGTEPFLGPEQAVVLDTDAERARAVAREYMSHYLKLENYARNLIRLGWAEEDVSGGGSDRLVDAIVCWGDADTIRARVRAHLESGADHVSVQVLAPDPHEMPLGQLRELAPALLG